MPPFDPKQTTRAVELRPLAANFDVLPGTATVPVLTFAAVAEEGVSTIWAKVKRDPTFPQPIRRGSRCTRFSVGDISAYLAGSK